MLDPDPIPENVPNQSGKPVVLTCAQPSSRLHLGNYLGAIQHWASFQTTHECFFGVVDLHAITNPQKPAELRQNSLSLVAEYVACGLDPEQSSIFLQSQVKGHTDLAWVLGCMTPLGQLQRMTQFKDKANRQESKAGFIGAGLLYYPVLQAADILLYNADIVPVGEDQKQHLELTRDLAERFNQHYSPTFKIPEAGIQKESARIMSLQDPSKKMSKSDPDLKSTLFLLDEPAVIRKKIMAAVTDTGQTIQVQEGKEGISNLLSILSALTHKTIKSLETELQGKGYGEFKEMVANTVIATLTPIQERYHNLIKNKAVLMKILERGQHNAQKRADYTLQKVYRKVGFLQP